MGGVRQAALVRQRQWLLARIGEQPYPAPATPRGRGVVVAIAVAWRFFCAEGLSFKKAAGPPSRTGPTWSADVVGRRGPPAPASERLDPARLLLRTIHDVALMLVRETAGCEASPTDGALGSQAVRVPFAPACGFDGGKRIVGPKRHLAGTPTEGCGWCASRLPTCRAVRARRQSSMPSASLDRGRKTSSPMRATTARG
jgi:hypothetical protein